MDKICLTVAYEGTEYVGWQIQPNGLSVQECLETALTRLAGSEIRVHSAGRTDAGVHARGMVCHFETERNLPLGAWRDGTNTFLPEDIAIRDAAKADASFHARFSAIAKHYRYTILCDPVRSPLERKTSWQVKKKLDLERLEVAMRRFCGRHDFSAFRTSGCAARSTVREILAISMKKCGSLIYIDVYGSGFLKNMIRMMVGTLVDVALRKRPVEDIDRLLNPPSLVAPALTAPAQGLCLMEIYYTDAAIKSLAP